MKWHLAAASPRGGHPTPPPTPLTPTPLGRGATKILHPFEGLVTEGGESRLQSFVVAGPCTSRDRRGFTRGCGPPASVSPGPTSLAPGYAEDTQHLLGGHATRGRLKGHAGQEIPELRSGAAHASPSRTPCPRLGADPVGAHSLAAGAHAPAHAPQPGLGAPWCGALLRRDESRLDAAPGASEPRLTPQLMAPVTV